MDREVEGVGSGFRFEANRAYTHKKLITTHVAGVDLKSLPVPFDRLHSELVENAEKIEAALAKLKVISASAVSSSSTNDDLASRHGRSADQTEPESSGMAS